MAASKKTAAAILKAFYDAETRYMAAPEDQRDISEMSTVLSPELKIIQTPALPYPGTFHGLRGLQEWSSKMAGYFDVLDVQHPEIFEREGSDSVIAVSNLHLRVRETGQVLDYPLCQVIKVDLEKGQILEMKPFYWDVHGLNEAVGFTPGSQK